MTPETHPIPHARVTLDAIFAEVTALRSDVAALKAAGHADDIRDHEARLRALERWIWRASGLAAAGGAAGGAVVAQIVSALA